ncbi:MAG: DUF6049 family protein [Bifidobacteriaceae bacterium]|nr:DUF6049 family protein [Bifidobacteriaceae bacterium]
MKLKRPAVAATALLASIAGVPSPAFGAVVEPETASVAIEEITPYVDSGTDTVTVAGVVVNTGAVPIAGEINLRLANEAFVDAAGVEAWQAAGVEDYPAWVVAADVLDWPIEPNATRPFRFDIPAEKFGFAAVEGLTWGPVGVVVDIATSVHSVAAARSFLLYAPQHAIRDRLELAVAMPLTARAGESGADAAARAAATVAATAEAPVDWILDPSLLALTDQPSTASEELASAISANAAGRSIFALPWGDPDVSQLAHAGTSGAGSLFALARSLGRATVRDELPDLAKTIRHDLVWPIDPVDSQLLTLVGRAGKDLRIASRPARPGASQGDTNVGAPSSDATAQRNSPSPGAKASAASPTGSPSESEVARRPQTLASAGPNSAGGRAASASPTDPSPLTVWPATVRLTASSTASGYGIVPDPDLTQAIDAGAGGATEAVAAQLAASLLAMRVMAYQAGHARNQAVVIVSRSSTADPATIARRASHILALPWVRAVPLADVVEESTGPMVRIGPGGDPERGPAAIVLDNLNDIARQLNAFSKVTADPAALMDDWTPRLLAPVAGSLTPAQTRTDQAASEVAAAGELISSVGAVEGSEVTMISATSELPVTIHNSSTFPVDLTVGLRAGEPALVTDEVVPVRLEPDARATVRVPVHAIANGDVDVTVHLLNRDGEDVGQPSTFRVRVHAEWENISTAIFLGAIGVLLVVGLTRAILRRIRPASRNGAPEPAA